MKTISLLLVFLLGMPFIVSGQQCEHLDIIPHPQWCSAFFLCRFGFWTVLVCPGGLVYDPENRRCDFPENVDCENDPDLTTPEWSSPVWTTRNFTWTTPTFSTPSVPTFSTPSVPTFSTPSVPTFSTPSVPTFSTPSVPTFSTPSVPTFSTPSVPTFTTPTWTTPTRPSTPTRRLRNHQFAKLSCNDSTLRNTLPHPLCEYFYKCIDGKAFEMKCDNGLVYNPRREYCDDPANVEC